MNPSKIKSIITNSKGSSPGYDGISRKTAKVLPLYELQDKMSVTNYRPISILPVFLKKFEKLLHKR